MLTLVAPVSPSVTHVHHMHMYITFGVSWHTYKKKTPLAAAFVACDVWVHGPHALSVLMLHMLQLHLETDNRKCSTCTMCTQPFAGHTSLRCCIIYYCDAFAVTITACQSVVQHDSCW